MPERKVLIACTSENVCEVIRDMADNYCFDAKIICDADAENDNIIKAYKEYAPDLAFMGANYEVAAEVCRNNETICDVYLLSGSDGEYSVGLPINLEQLSSIFEMHKMNDNKSILFDDLILNDEEMLLTVAGKSYKLTLPETAMLRHFVSNPNRVFSREQLAYEVFGPGISELEMLTENTVELLKEKLDGASGKWGLKLSWGVGYKFEVAI